MPDEDAEQRHQSEHEVAVLRHWKTFLGTCKQEGMDSVALLASLGAKDETLLLEHPEHAEAWLARLNRNVRDELHLRRQEPS